MDIWGVCFYSPVDNTGSLDFVLQIKRLLEESPLLSGISAQIYYRFPNCQSINYKSICGQGSEDYKRKSLFFNNLQNLHKILDDLWIDEELSAVYLAELNMYAIFKYASRGCLWSLIGHVLPNPDIYMGAVIPLPIRSKKPIEYRFNSEHPMPIFNIGNIKRIS